MPPSKKPPPLPGSYAATKRASSRHITRRTIDGQSVLSFGNRPFIGVDGEGGNTLLDGKRHHVYKLLRVGDSELFNSDGSELSSRQCLDFLSRLENGNVYVAFYFDYDVTMILRGLPEERLKRVFNPRPMERNPGSYWPTDIGRYQVKYMRGKELAVRRNDGSEQAPKWSTWVTVSDVGSFFQCSFVKALRQWFTEASYERTIQLIEEGKAMRAEFEELTSHTREYCGLEVRMLALLMERFREMCSGVNIRPQKWQGPGNLVAAVMRREGFPRNKDLSLWGTPIGNHVLGMANAAYYGGRFEAGVIGNIEGPIYQYDINSAYPSVYRRLPCLVHGKWHPINSRSSSLLGSDSLWIGRIGFDHRPNVHYCGFPVRTKDGTIVFPRAGRGIYWSHEIEAAHPYLEDWHFSNGFVYEARCGCEPFDWVYEIYEERKRVGKGGKGIPLKLVLNSTYGKLCQSIGTAPYANPIWASLITSYVRATLYRAAMASRDPSQPGLGTLMLATDGIFTLDERTLPIGTQLGEWEATTHDNMFVVQSGLYFIDNKMPKTRGTPGARIAAMETQFRTEWSKYIQEVGSWSSDVDFRNCNVNVPVVNFVSLALALARGKPGTAGEWIAEDKAISFDWRNKREITYPPIVHKEELFTLPRGGGIEFDNVPYSKRIGALHAGTRLETSGQPDWNFGPFGDA